MQKIEGPFYVVPAHEIEAYERKIEDLKQFLLERLAAHDADREPADLFRSMKPKAQERVRQAWENQ